MKRQTILGIILLLLVTAVLVQPLILLARKQATDSTGGNQLVFLPVIQTPPGPPDFEIISPNNGWTVSGMMFFAVQVRDPETVTSVTFNAGATPLGTDNTPADGFRVFFDASNFPDGNVTLTAVGHGPSGQTNKSITVNVVSNPASSGTIGTQGGVLASEIGSLITIPPNALPNGTQVSVDELSQAEVTTQNGIDWEAMGVTFLGAQSIQSTAASPLPYRVASADFGNRVQPGQTVVNYQLLPDADGDGVDEIIVVNTASVAPNNDVISDPIPQVLLEDTAVTANGRHAFVAGGSVGGPPGTSLALPVAGFNPLSASGNVAEWLCADGRRITVPGTIRPNSANPQGQLFATTIPLCAAGPALVMLRNLSTGSAGGPFTILVTEPPPLGGPPGTGTLDFLDYLDEMLDAIPDSLDPESLPPDWKNNIRNSIEAARQDTQDRMNDPTPENLEDLEDSDTLLPEPEQEFPELEPDADCLTSEAKEAINDQIDHLHLIASEWYFKDEDALGDYYMHIARQLFEMKQLPTCEEEPECVLSPAAAGSAVITGMGSAPPPGGPVCGNVMQPGGGSSRANIGTDGIIIKIFSGGFATPFSGVVDPGGYFAIPFIPADSPFTAVAYDLGTGETRVADGVGPVTGESAFLFFDFFTEPPESDTITWDGGGDGTSWHDANNWSDDTVPGAADDVVIDVPGQITVTHSFGSHAVRSLHSEEDILLTSGILDIEQSSIISGTLALRGGSLSGNGDVTLNGFLAWRQGNMGGPGTTTANGGIRFFVNINRGLIDGRTLINNGTAVWQNGYLTLLSGSTLINEVGSTFDFQGDFVNGVSGSSSLFLNRGTVIKRAGSGPGAITLPFNNSGTIEVQDGTLVIQGDGTHSGTFQGAGALEIRGRTNVLDGSLSGLDVLFLGDTTTVSNTLVINGSYQASSTTIAGDNTLTQARLRVNEGVTATSETLTLDGGAVIGAGDLVISGQTTWLEGNMRGTGTTTAVGGLTLSGNHSRTLDGRTLVNEGTAVYEDGFLTLLNGAVLQNSATASWEFQGDDNLSVSTGGGTFQNDGSLTKSGGSGVTAINPTFINNGNVAVQTGRLQFGSDFTQTASGTLFVQIGGLTPITEFDQFNISGSANLDGTLDVSLSGGFVPTAGDSFTIMTFASRTGQFATVNGHGQSYNTNYNATDVTLTAQ